MDLRAEVDNEAWVRQINTDYTKAELHDVDLALCRFAIKVTRRPWTVVQEDIDQLREVGLDDRAINDAVQVIAFFNYINRVGDALGIDLEPEMPPRPDTAEEC
jgi:uncharacterized peroxidase-related enzyme